MLLNCIWKLSGPNIFDGMLTEDFILSPEVAQMYQEILDEAPTPIVTAAAKGLTDWVSAKKGEPLGTYDDMSQMYEAYNDIFKNALTLMDELYPMN